MVSGDGGLGQYLAQINTAVKYDMDITHVLLNNGKIGKEQRAGNWDVWQPVFTIQTSPSMPSCAAAEVFA